MSDQGGNFGGFNPAPIQQNFLQQGAPSHAPRVNPLQPGIQPTGAPRPMRNGLGDMDPQRLAMLLQHPQIQALLQGGGNLGGSGVGSADSGHDFGGSRGPGQGARGTAEQGVGWADALMGLAMGAIAGPIAGIATTTARTALDPSYNPIDPYGFLGSLFGGSSSTADSMGNNPGISGSTGFTGAESTAATGEGTGGASGLGGGGPSSGIGAGPGGSNAGAYAGGGIVGGMAPFSPWQDNKMAQVRSGEAILPSGMVNQLGPQNIMNMINRYRQSGMNPIGRSIMPQGVQQILGR